MRCACWRAAAASAASHCSGGKPAAARLWFAASSNILSGEPYWGEAAACEIGVSNNAAKTTAATMARQRKKVDIGNAPASIKHGVLEMDARSKVQMAQEEAGRPDRPP